MGARADNDLGKVSRVKKNCLSNTVLVSRARVGARAEVTKNDLGKVSRKNIFSQMDQRVLGEIVFHVSCF